MPSSYHSFPLPPSPKGDLVPSPPEVSSGIPYPEEVLATMSSEPVTPEDLRGVFAVPPLPRRPDPRRTLNLDEAERVAAHVARGGITRLLYGGNAFLYHVTLAEYESEDGFGADRERGLDAIGRLVSDGVCVAVKYAVVRSDPGQDAYLEGLLRRVDRGRVVSGIGERPAVVHARTFGLAGFTTGSGCVAPRLSGALLAAMAGGDWARAVAVRAEFLALEDLRDAWGPVSPLGPEELERLAPVARALVEKDA